MLGCNFSSSLFVCLSFGQVGWQEVPPFCFSSCTRKLAPGEVQWLQVRFHMFPVFPTNWLQGRSKWLQVRFHMFPVKKSTWEAGLDFNSVWQQPSTSQHLTSSCEHSSQSSSFPSFQIREYFLSSRPRLAGQGQVRVKAEISWLLCHTLEAGSSC